jgi:hypothetical protein
MELVALERDGSRALAKDRLFAEDPRGRESSRVALLGDELGDSRLCNDLQPAASKQVGATDVVGVSV